MIDLAGLGHALQWKQLDREAGECGKEALRRDRGDCRFAVGTDNSEQMNDVLNLGKKFAELNTIDVSCIKPDGVFNAGDVRLAATFIDGLTVKQDLVRIITLWKNLSRPSRKKLAEDAAIRVAALSNAHIQSWSEFKLFRCSIVAGCWSQLVNTPLDATPSYPFPANWQDYSNKESMAQMTHEWFFKTVLVALTTTAEFSWVPATSSRSAYFPEAVTYLDRMTQYAETVAGMWKREVPVAFHQFYALFADLNPPGKHEQNKRYPHSEFCKTLIPIVVDCHLLGAALGAIPLIDAASLELAAQSSWFNLHHFREIYAQNGVRLLTDEAARFLIGHGKAYLLQWEETCEYSRALLELCEVALLHEMEAEARELCRLCWEYVLGYGHRKDSTILSLLNAIEYLADDAPDFCRATLKEIAPQIHHITDYTDGKGTRQAQGYADELLVRLDRTSLAEKYAGHISSGDWPYADEALATFFTADISSVVFEAIARTGLPKEAIANLRDRASQGEQRAFELLEIADTHSGASFGTMERSDSQGNSNDLVEFEGKPEEYPSENFDMLISAMKESKTYGLYSYLPKWYAYWAGQGQESALLRILEPRLLSESGSRDDCHYLLDQAFESSLKLYGKPRAFKFAVQAQKEMGGWLDFYESARKSKQRLQRIAELYPKRADEFITASCFSKWRNRQQPNPRVIPSDKLVFFLVKLGRTQEVADLVRAMVESIQEDTRNLPLTTPAWATNNAGQEIPSTAELRVLIARVTWPVPAVKWWGIQELAVLLNSPLVESVESELYRALANAKLETEVMELLCVFWLAKQSGFVPSIVLSTHVNAASPASALVLSAIIKPLLFEGSLRVPLILAPSTYKATADFEEAQGVTVSKIFFTLLKNLEHPQLPSFVKQYAFEWENTATLYPEAPFQGNIGYFYNHSLDEMAGQFVTRSSHRGRSAYLRTLAIAQEICDAPQRLDHVQVVLPLDPTLASLRPSKPNWLPDWDRNSQPEHAEIEAYIRLAVQNLTASEPGITLLALSMPLLLSEELIIDLEVVRWVQWEERPIDAEMLYIRHDQRRVDHGWCKVKALQTTTRCPAIPLDKVCDIETCSAPTAGEPGRWRRGYLHADLDSRGIILPVSTVKDVEIDIRPNGGYLELMTGTKKFGKWQYWNAGWNPSHHQSIKSCCGIVLIANTELLPQLWEKERIRHFFHWRCTILKREESYSKEL